MSRTSPLAVLVLAGALAARGAAGQAQEAAPALEARVWLDRGEEPVLQRGDQVRVYYRTSEDAYAAIFRIDTDGAITMVFPQHPGAIAPVRGGRDYRLLFPGAPSWPVRDDPGSGYYFIVASRQPLDFSQFAYDERVGWDLGAVGGVVYEDPYVAIDDYVAALVPGWEVVPYALDFLTYHVGNTYSYPRFLCYDCHTRQSYSAWNPYSAVCTSFRVVIWDDPYFYPSYRYSGTRVVVARPARALPRYEVVTRSPGDIGVRPLVLARAAPERRGAQFKEAPTVAPSQRIPVRRSSSAVPVRQAPDGARRVQQGPESASGRPTLQRRPDARLPVRTPPSASDPTGPQGRPAGGAPGRDEATAADRADPPAPDRRVAPARQPTRPAPRAPSARTPQARPSAPVQPYPRARGSAAPGSRPSARPTAPSRPSARPAAPAPSRPATRPAAPQGRPATRPSSPPSSRPSARPAPGSREPSPRPTVRPRGTARRN